MPDAMKERMVVAFQGVSEGPRYSLSLPTRASRAARNHVIRDQLDRLTLQEWNQPFEPQWLAGASEPWTLQPMMLFADQHDPPRQD